MTKNLDKEGLSSIVDKYQLFYVDLWGVVHNGVTLHLEAIKALKEISKKNKNYILLTNAAGNYTKPKMRATLFRRIKAQAVQGTAAGQWSARKAQLLAKEYKKRGGGYTS